MLCPQLFSGYPANSPVPVIARRRWRRGRPRRWTTAYGWTRGCNPFLLSFSRCPHRLSVRAPRKNPQVTAQRLREALAAPKATYAAMHGVLMPEDSHDHTYQPEPPQPGPPPRTHTPAPRTGPTFLPEGSNPQLTDQKLRESLAAPKAILAAMHGVFMTEYSHDPTYPPEPHHPGLPPTRPYPPLPTICPPQGPATNLISNEPQAEYAPPLVRNRSRSPLGKTPSSPVTPCAMRRRSARRMSRGRGRGRTIRKRRTRRMRRRSARRRRTIR